MKTALITGVVMSGLDSTRFTFEGFLSVNKKQRKTRLEELQTEKRTMIFYEAPHKLLATLQDLYKYFGNRNICIARELTKIHEEYIYTTLLDAIKMVEENGIKGEIVLVVEGEKNSLKASDENILNTSNKELVLNEIKAGLDKKEAIKKIAKLKGLTKNEVYQECIDI